jgi:hypothetical protein
MTQIKANGYRSDYTTSVGMAEHGWTRAAIDRFLGEPDRLAANPHYRSGPLMRLYRVERVLAIQNSPEFKVWMAEKHARKQKANTAQARRFEGFSRKYGSWREALPDACEYLFNLNRYAKHESCSDQNRDDIYDLKTELVALLYRHGYCTECYLHTSELAAKSCWSCDGTGTWESDWGDYSDKCWKCNGSGVYLNAKTLTFVCFRFNVAGQTYCWHQPEDLVLFNYEVTAESSTWTPGDEEKPITLSKAKFAVAKDLLRWVVSSAATEIGRSAAA